LDCLFSDRPIKSSGCLVEYLAVSMCGVCGNREEALIVDVTNATDGSVYLD